MAIVYTTSWQANRSDSFDSREFGTVAFIITTAGETLDPVNVMTATHQTTGAPLPKVGDPSSLDPRYFVQQTSLARFEGPRSAIISIGYRLGKGSGEQENEDPLSNPVRYRVRNGITGEPTDADVRGNPLINSAGDPFTATVQTSIAAIYIDVIRNESAFNLPQSIAFTNKINADTFSLAGYPINPGEAYCLGIQPERDYSLADDYVPVVYSFELRERLTLQNNDRYTAFTHRILDKGKRGWANVPGGDGESVKLADIATDNGADTPSPVSSDVNLNEGRPVEEDQFIAMDPFFDGWIINDKAGNAVKDVNEGTKATFLLYDKHLEKNFSELGL